MWRSIVLAVAAQLAIGGVAVAQAPPPVPAPTPAPAAAPPLLPVIPFEDAVLKAATDLFSKANLPPDAPERLTLVIDPLIDGVTTAQSTATQYMERRIVELVRTSFPRFQVKPFSTDEIARTPVVLIGTFTAVNNAGLAGAPKDAYRICLALADFATRKIISKGVARAKLEGVDVTPTVFFDEAPVFSKDAASDSYIKSCQGTRPGDPIDQVYADRILSAALLSDAVIAYQKRRYTDSLELYQSALKAPGGEPLRALNGIYLATLHLGRRTASAAAFGKLVGYGLANDKLAIKFLFRPGSTQFVAQQRGGRSLYRMWLAQIAEHTRDSGACLDIVGHTSASGPPALNDRLSALRAEFVKDRLVDARAELSSRLIASGAGGRQNIVGTGRDDASDALDRRVEFKVIRDCLPSNKQALLAR